MKAFFASIFFMFIGVIVFSQGAELPSLTDVDSIRVQKRKLSPSDTTRAIRIFSISFRGATNADSLKHKKDEIPFQDSTIVANTLKVRIWEENNRSANNTYLLYQQLTKSKGIDQYNKLYKRVTGQNYFEWTWTQYSAQYVGTWNVYGQGITAHQMQVNSTAQAERQTGTPKYKGNFRILSDNRIELVGYFKAGESVVFDFVTKNGNAAVFMSTDGKFWIEK